ncbi:short-subunit dehydrogenase [Diaminobutyricimonas aerilata]|uniref:Short-subunit dehydrogenase n=1 Tax=Diaminobutyricimonas aerilata TaxID=1162967 RepID=A0A2M9CH78_9MICO|nr:SDR family oxidoreductase [Diaminobutyricimonas aerilata]PJJ71276.1 short-subunit dehydrogenase [Diaminobutyricimonas aerilata]
MTALRDSTVLITGANGGLGRSFVREALARGARKVYATARTPQEWDDARVVPLALDIDSIESVEAAAAVATDTTILINNAGVSDGGRRVLSIPVDDARRILGTNVVAQLAMTQRFAPVLADNGGGAVVNIHSALSWLGTGVYASSKAAFWSLSNALRVELREQGTHLVGAHLGYTDTPMTERLDVPKENPDDIVAAIFDGLEAGDYEVLADEASRATKAALSAPLEALYPALARV